MQKFIPEVIEGDKRIIIVNGEAIGLINRIPQGGDFRSNLAMGGEGEPTLLTEKEKVSAQNYLNTSKMRVYFL